MDELRTFRWFGTQDTLPLDKCTNEILSEDLRSVTTVKLNEGMQALMPRPFFLNPAQERMVFLDFDISEFRHSGYLGVSPLVLASPKTQIREILK